MDSSKILIGGSSQDEAPERRGMRSVSAEQKDHAAPSQARFKAEGAGTIDPMEAAREARDLAVTARRLSHNIYNPVEQARLREIAVDLDNEAAAFERETMLSLSARKTPAEE